MLLSWWRRRAELTKRQHLPSQRRRLAFERLEERCLLSAKPFGDAGLLLADQPGKDLPTVPLLAGNGRIGISLSDVRGGSDIRGDAQTELPQLTLPASNVDNDPSQQPPPFDNGESPPDDQNTLKPLPQDQSIPGDDSSQNRPPPELGNQLAANENTLESSPHGLGNLSVDVPLLGVGKMYMSHGDTGLKIPFPGGAKLLSNGGDGGDRPVSPGVRDLGLSASTLPSQWTTSDFQDLHAAARASTAAPLVLATGLSGYPDTHSGVDRTLDRDLTVGDSPVRLGLNTIFERAFQWRFGEAIAYADTGNSLNSPSLGVAGERLVNVSAGITSTDGGPQVNPASVGIEGRSEMRETLAGREQLVEKAASGTGTVASTILISAATESTHRNQTLSITALTGEPASWQAHGTPGSAAGQQLVNIPPSSSSGNTSRSDGLPALQALDSMDRFGLFQRDVATAGPVPGDMAMAVTTGTSSVYLANEESSIWSILTTYALVIIPRLRKHQPTILVVDPDDATRDALSVGLVREGYFVLPAASVRDAWGMFRTPHARIDLVLMDPHLPDVSGIHLCARLREISPTLPVMVCAGEVEPAEVAQLQQLGVRYYLRKPIAFEELLYTVRAILP